MSNFAKRSYALEIVEDATNVIRAANMLGAHEYSPQVSTEYVFNDLLDRI